MQFAAPKVTRFASGVTDSPVENGSSIKVYGIHVQGTSAGQVLVEENDGSTVLFEISVPANGSYVMNVPFVSDRGIKITTPAAVTCTVLHSNVL